MANTNHFEQQIVRVYSQAASTVSFLPSWYRIASLVFTVFAIAACRRRYFSPISNIPGPFLASITRLWHVFHILQGKQSVLLTRLHEKHGPFVRISHDEVSVSHAEAPKKLLLAVLKKVSSSLLT